MPKSETVNIGHETVEQTLLDGVTPITQADKHAQAIKASIEQPLRSSQAQKPCTVGLWDDDKRNQLDLF